jgi:predicted enzyme related to lactoylglutathione lyase
MTERVGELAYVIIDCNDSQLLASFWGNVLGLEITRRSSPYIDLAPSSDQSPLISFQRVEEPKVSKNRLHLDIKVDDLETATETIQSLGGKLVQECFDDPYVWRVMADPEDNEFCIVTD